MNTLKTIFKKRRVPIIIFFVFLTLSLIGLVFYYFGIVHIATLNFQSEILVGVLFVTAWIFGVLWILSAPSIHRLLLFVGLALTTQELLTSIGSSPLLAFIGSILVILAGIPFFSKRPIILVIAYSCFFLVAGIFARDFSWGGLTIRALGLLTAGLSLFIPHKKFNFWIAGASLVTPVFTSILLLALSLSGLPKQLAATHGEFSSPFEDHLLFKQKKVTSLIDVNYVLEIYEPIAIGFYQEIGSYSSEGFIPELTPTDFEWETIDAETFVLHFYEVEGEMQYSLTIHR